MDTEIMDRAKAEVVMHEVCRLAEEAKERLELDRHGEAISSLLGLPSHVQRLLQYLSSSWGEEVVEQETATPGLYL